MTVVDEPDIDDVYAEKMTHRTRRCDQLERKAQEDQEQLEIAEAVAGSEVCADDSSGPDESGGNDDAPLYVDDRVTPGMGIDRSS